MHNIVVRTKGGQIITATDASFHVVEMAAEEGEMVGILVMKTSYLSPQTVTRGPLEFVNKAFSTLYDELKHVQRLYNFDFYEDGRFSETVVTKLLKGPVDICQQGV